MGIVVRHDDKGRMLVVDPKPRRGGSNDEFYDAIWVRVKNSEQAKLGDEVGIVFDGEIATSYPAQAQALKLVIMNETKPEKAFHPKQEAIRIALERLPDWKIPVVIQTTFDANDKTWTVVMKDVMFSFEKDQTIVINDTDGTIK